MNIVIVEDCELINTQLLRMIAAQPLIHVMGCATNAETAVALILTKHPDVVLLDLSLAPGNGIEVIKRIRAAGSTARLLVLTNYTSDVLRKTCIELGAAGFYDKSHEVPACLNQLFAWSPQYEQHAFPCPVI
ncbi:MAG: response regulator transcription factor [Pseudomonadota bacterium]